MRGNGRAPRWATAVAVVVSVVVVAAMASMLLRGRPVEVLWERWLLHNAPFMAAALWLGHLVLRKEPRHGAGLVLLLIGALGGLHVGLMTVVDAQLVAAGLGETAGTTTFVPADLPLRVSVPFWLGSWLWVPTAVAFSTLLLLVFPDGQLPTPRWRWVVALAATGTVLLCIALASMTWPGSMEPVAVNEMPIVTPVRLALTVVGGLAVLVAGLASVAALVQRWRAGDTERRRQIRAVVAAGSVMALTMTFLWPWQALWKPTILLTGSLFLVTYGLAIARYRLHDLDVVISRAVVGAILAAAVTGVYLALVVGVGSAVGRGSDRVLLPLLATGLVAVLFEPVRQRVRRLVDRMIYGREADAYEVLSDLAGRMSEADSADDLLERVVAMLVRSTGAQRAEVHVHVDGADWLAAAEGSAAHHEPVLSASVAHRGEPLGEVRLYARAASQLARDAEDVLHDVAGALGVVLRNTLITAELRHQVEELHRSRERLVHVHDEARRGLERDIHDGAQARLIALRIRLGAAATLAQQEASPQLAALLAELGEDTDAAVRSLRDLARGLHPPVLTQLGIGAALASEARRLPLAVDHDVDGAGRYDEAVEAAVYFSCLEALQNAARHGQAQRVEISIGNGGGALTFCVSDDGAGFDRTATPDGAGLTNVADRLAALGGQLTVDTAAGRGTRVRGTVPAQPVSAR